MLQNIFNTNCGICETVKQKAYCKSSLYKLQATVHTASKSHMMCSTDESQLMRLFMQLLKAKKVIEIGKIHQCMNLCCYEKATSVYSYSSYCLV